MLKLVYKKSFKNDVKKLEKRHYDMSLLNKVIILLASGESLPAKYKEHKLSGKFEHAFECHIAPDWLLIYLRNLKTITLTFTHTGTHSDLFK